VTSQTDLVKAAQFGDITIRNVNGFPIKIRDVAKVEEAAADDRSRVRLNGKSAISAGVIRQATANPLELSKGVREMMPRLQQDLPGDISINVANDNSVFIDKSIKSVFKTILEAVILVALVIFVFLRTLRASIIPIITIPVSLIGTFAIMALAGFTINTLTLLALVLAIGLVVDDAIVMLENIFRHIEEGLDPFSAAIKGAKEIGFAIVAMSMTLAAVFAPLAFTPGRTGKLFSEFALALAGAVLVSGLVALTLTPMMSSLLLRHNPNPSKFDNFMERVLVAISNGYEKLLVIVLRKLRWLVVSVMAACGVGIFLVYPTMKQELSPLEDRGTVLVTVTAPDGSTLDYTDKYAKTLEKIGSTYPEFDRIFANLGNPTVAQGSVIYRAVDWDERKRTTLEIARELQGKFNGIAGINAFPITPPSLGQGFRERPVNFVIQTSDSYQNLNTVTRQMLDEIAKNPGFISPDVDLRLNKPELRVDVDRIKATELGVSVEVVAKAVETMLGGRVVTRYKRDAEQYDVIVQTQVSGRNTPSDIDNIYVRGRNDSVIPLSALVKVRESVSPRELNHFGQRRSVSITANLAPEYSLGEALKFLDKTAAGILKPGYTTELNGTSREFRNSQGALVIVFVLALFFIFLVLAAQFESFIDPLVIMLSVPLSMFGAIMTLKLTGGSLNVYSQIGLITLVGLITKHGILIVEFTNQLREQGVDTFDAIVKASAQRLRPILMTTGAMVLGALPLAMATGAGAESRIQIGWVIVGGMSFGTLLTVFVVPTMYTLFARKSVPGPNKADALDTPNQVGHAHS
jgi:multidrug efflux pump